MANRRVFINIGLLLLLLIVLGVRAVLLDRFPAKPAVPTPVPEGFTATPVPTHTAAAEATAIEPALTATAAPTATGTAEPTWTPAATASSTPETTILVAGDFVNLRAGPGITYVSLGKLTWDDGLVLLGRLEDGSWLNVRTSGGQVGWIEAAWVDIAGIDLAGIPVRTPEPFTEITVRVAGDYVNLRTGPGTNFSKLRLLEFGEPLTLLGRVEDNSWLNVKTADGQEGWVETTLVDLGWLNIDFHYQPVKTSPPTETSVPQPLPGIEGRWIDIDISDQMLYAFEGDQLVASFLVSTGIAGYPTEPGEYHIDAKLRYSDMRGNDYYLKDVPFTMYYHGDFAIHGTTWHHNFGTPMSRGCVNMDVSDAEWLYNWASVGTFVNIHR